MSDTATYGEHIFARNLFDAEWYAGTYPDVGLSGLAPDYHYRHYGFPILSRPPAARFCSHPGLFRALRLTPPAPGQELLRADQIETNGDGELAVDFATLHLPEKTAYTSHIIRANAALRADNTTCWLKGLNAYLDHFGTEAVTLSSEPGDLIKRFGTSPLEPITGGPLISIIMPAWNAEDTIEMAVGSILSQSWRNLELIVVDDASKDGTWSILGRLAKIDCRLRIRRNRVNVGPYVSKNLGLDMACGEWITGHDADDWAHPRRIERHITEVLAQPSPPRASLTYMIRMTPSGRFDTIVSVNNFSPDGVSRVSSISTLFSRKLLHRDLGYWDSVRFGADTEMISRARKFLGDEFLHLEQIGMICLSTETGLTNHPEFGLCVNGRSAPDRLAYKNTWSNVIEASAPSALYLPFPQITRRYQGKFNHSVPFSDLKAVISGIQSSEPS